MWFVLANESMVFPSSMGYVVEVDTTSTTLDLKGERDIEP